MSRHPSLAVWLVHLLAVVALSCAAAGCYSSAEVRPDTLAQLGVGGEGGSPTVVRRLDGTEVSVPRDFDAELVMRNGERWSFRAPVTAWLDPPVELVVADRSHELRARVGDVVSTHVLYAGGDDDGDTVTGVVFASVGVLAVAGAILMAALASSMHGFCSGGCGP